MVGYFMGWKSITARSPSWDSQAHREESQQAVAWWLLPIGSRLYQSIKTIAKAASGTPGKYCRIMYRRRHEHSRLVVLNHCLHFTFSKTSLHRGHSSIYKLNLLCNISQFSKFRLIVSRESAHPSPFTSFNKTPLNRDTAAIPPFSLMRK